MPYRNKLEENSSFRKKPALLNGRTNIGFTVENEKHFNKKEIWLLGSASKPKGSICQMQSHKRVRINGR